jgi:surface antigen
MRSSSSLFSFYASALTAFMLVAAIFFFPDLARAESTGQTGKQGAAPSCSRPNSNSASVKPKLARLAEPLDENDQIAALESVQLALSQVADGSSYVWHRSHGRLSGIVRPTASFKDHKGQVCRHLVVVLNSFDETSKTEAIACRLNTGVWELDG